MEIPIDYHIIFIMMSFIFFILIMFLIFIDNDFNKTVAAFILSMFNSVLCIISALSFFSINIFTVDATGTLVSNPYHDLGIFSIVFVILFYINILLVIFCIYLFYKKPWEVLGAKREEEFYRNPRI